MVQSRFGYYSFILAMALFSWGKTTLCADDKDQATPPVPGTDDLDLLGDAPAPKATKTDPAEPGKDQNTGASKSKPLTPGVNNAAQSDVDLGMDNLDDCLQEDSDEDNQNKRKSYAFFGLGIGAGGLQIKPTKLTTDNQAPSQLTVPTGYTNVGAKLDNPNAGNANMPFALNMENDLTTDSSFFLPIRFGYRAYLGNSPVFSGFQAGVMWCNFETKMPLTLNYYQYDITPLAAASQPPTSAEITNKRSQTADVTSNITQRFSMDTRFVLGATVGDRLSMYGSIGWSGNRIGTSAGSYAAAPGAPILSNAQGGDKITENKFASGAIGAVGMDYAMGSVLIGVEGFSIFGIGKTMRIYQYNNVSSNPFMSPYVDSCMGELNTTIWGVLLTASFKFEDL